MMFFLLLSLLLLQLSSGLLMDRVHFQKSIMRLQMDSSSSGNAPTTSNEAGSMIIPEDESAEDKYKREKLAEIAERKAQEVFVTRSTGKYECQACGYVYDIKTGYPKRGIEANTPFEEIGESFRCPQCGAGKKYFVEEEETLSGFKENLKYGFGANNLTGGQKQNLIFGGLFIGFAVFMSGYLLE